VVSSFSQQVSDDEEEQHPSFALSSLSAWQFEVLSDAHEAETRVIIEGELERRRAATDAADDSVKSG
jgi:hypothetical protein